MSLFFHANKNLSRLFIFLLNLGSVENTNLNKNSYVRLANLNGLIYFLLSLFLACIFYTVFNDVPISLGFMGAGFLFLTCSIGFNFIGWGALSWLSTAILCFLLPLVGFAILSTNRKFGFDIEVANSSSLFLLQTAFFLVPLVSILMNSFILITERERRIKNLEQSQVLLETIFFALSHDLANPLQSVYMISKMAEEKDSITAEKIKTISRNINKMVRIFDNLKNIARTSLNGKLTLQLKMHPISELIEEAIESVEDQANAKRISISYELPKQDSFYQQVFVDRDIFVHQILGNFLTNSVKFSEIGQKIKITVDHIHATNQVQLVIRDWGCGIEHEKVNKLFSWQQQTSSLGTHGELGTGIGLPLALKFLKSMSGDLKLASNHHTVSDTNTRGTQITLILPAHTSEYLDKTA